MTKRAMAEFECPEGRLKSLMLAYLAGVVLLGEDTLTRGDTGREVTTALTTVDVKLCDHSLTVRLRALELLLLLIGWRMSTE